MSFFGRLFHFRRADLPAHLPTLHSVQQLLTKKNGMTLCPTLSIHPISAPPNPPATSFSRWKKKTLKGKHFAEAEVVKQKTAEALKGIKINMFRNCFEQWKNISIGILHQMERTFKGTEFKHVRINTQFCINKFPFFGPSLLALAKVINIFQVTIYIWHFSVLSFDLSATLIAADHSLLRRGLPLYLPWSSVPWQVCVLDSLAGANCE